MFDFLRKANRASGSMARGGATPVPAAQAVEALDAALLMDLLCGAASILPMSRLEATVVVDYMRARQYAPEEVIIRSGDKANVDYMLWILQGEASIEAVAANKGAPITMTVLGPGATLGEMGLIDGAPRSVNCVASAPLRCAILDKALLQQLHRDHPAVAAKLMSIICTSLSVRLRDITEKFKRYVQLNRALSEELRELAPIESLD